LAVAGLIACAGMVTRGENWHKIIFQIVEKISRHGDSVCYFQSMTTRSNTTQRLTESASAGCHNTTHKGKTNEHDNNPQMDKGRQHRPILSGIL
jgi:hypothetical protein